MKQVISDFKDELEQNLRAGVETVKAEPKKILQSVKSGLTGKTPPSNDFGKALEKMAAKSPGQVSPDPLVGDKPAPTKQMMSRISDASLQKARKDIEEVREQLEKIRNEKLDSEKKMSATQDPGQGPAMPAPKPKLTPIQQNIRNAETNVESKDTGGMG